MTSSQVIILRPFTTSGQTCLCWSMENNFIPSWISRPVTTEESLISLYTCKPLFKNANPTLLRFMAPKPDWLWHLKHTACKHVSRQCLQQANQFRRRQPCTVAIYWSDLQRITRGTFNVCFYVPPTKPLRCDQKNTCNAWGAIICELKGPRLLSPSPPLSMLLTSERQRSWCVWRHQAAHVRARWNAVMCGGWMVCVIKKRKQTARSACFLLEEKED